MYLNATTDLLRVNIASAIDLRAAVFFGQAADGTPPGVEDFDTTILAAQTGTGNVTLLAGQTNKIIKPKGATLYNAHASNSSVIYLDYSDGTNASILAGSRCILLPGEGLRMLESGLCIHQDANGAPYPSKAVQTIFNRSTAAQGAGFATDTYLTGSYLKFPGLPKVGTKYRCKFSVSKTAAGTATPIIQVRTGTAGSTSDTSRNSFTFSAGTAATDVGVFEIIIVFRAVGSGTTAVMQGSCALTSQPTTGLSSLIKAVQTTSGGFDSTTADLGIGVSVNGGTSAAWTVQLVEAELSDLL